MGNGENFHTNHDLTNLLLLTAAAVGFDSDATLMIWAQTRLSQARDATTELRLRSWLVDEIEMSAESWGFIRGWKKDNDRNWERWVED